MPNGFVYDIPDAPGASDDTPQKRQRLLFEDKARRVLGKAVHPNALRRLFELWPDAVVYVNHEIPDREGDRGAQFRREGRSAEPWTRVVIRRARGASTALVIGTAKCAPGDRFNRRYGIALAFRRALAEVRERTK